MGHLNEARKHESMLVECNILQQTASFRKFQLVKVNTSIWVREKVHGLAALGPRLIAGLGDETVRIVQQGAAAVARADWAETVLRGHTGAVTGVGTVGQRVLSGSTDGTVRVWEPGRGFPGIAELPAGSPGSRRRCCRG